MRKLLKRLVIGLLVVYFLVLLWVYFTQRSLMYFPDKDILPAESYDLYGTSESMIESADGSMIQVWYNKPQPGKPVVLYLHGNSYNLGKFSDRFRELQAMGYGFVAPSYRSFGKSEGQISKEGIIMDAMAAVKFLQDQGYKTEDSLLVGESLGSGVSLEVAMKHKFKGILLIAPYTSIAERAQQIYWYLPAKLLLKDDFTNCDKVAKVGTKLMIVHGNKDDVIPVAHSHVLNDLAIEPKRVIFYEGKGHNNLDYKDVFTNMTEFFLDDAKNKE